jgi:hypothetical protein
MDEVLELVFVDQKEEKKTGQEPPRRRSVRKEGKPAEQAAH